jgi:hypothetical protein
MGMTPQTPSKGEKLQNSTLQPDVTVGHLKALFRSTSNLLDVAAEQRRGLIEQIGVDTYLYQMLGRHADRSATCLYAIVWRDRIERLADGVLSEEEGLAEYLTRRSLDAQTLPRFVICKEGRWLFI